MVVLKVAIQVRTVMFHTSLQDFLRVFHFSEISKVVFLSHKFRLQMLVNTGPEIKAQYYDEFLTCLFCAFAVLWFDDLVTWYCCDLRFCMSFGYHVCLCSGLVLCFLSKVFRLYSRAQLFYIIMSLADKISTNHAFSNDLQLPHLKYRKLS